MTNCTTETKDTINCLSLKSSSVRFKMNSKPYIILGEAQESDSEQELNLSEVSKGHFEQYKGKIVTGEAPESDEEVKGNVVDIHSLTKTMSALPVPLPRKKRNHRSILIKKLCERNASLYKNINEFVKHTATNAGNELNVTNQRLLKCQVQLQEGADYLKKLNSNLSVLDYNLQSLLSTSFIPTINISEELQTPV